VEDCQEQQQQQVVSSLLFLSLNSLVIHLMDSTSRPGSEALPLRRRSSSPANDLFFLLLLCNRFINTPTYRQRSRPDQTSWTITHLNSPSLILFPPLPICDQVSQVPVAHYSSRVLCQHKKNEIRSTTRQDRARRNC
jgi:hypothetical protein